jgi:hypothetical protein
LRLRETNKSVASLRWYLDALKRDAQASQQHRNREHAGMLAHYAAKNQRSIEMLKAVPEAGKSALHALLIINGGAVIALLGVMSNLAGKTGGAALGRYLALPLLQFGIGVIVGAIGFAFRYLSRTCYSGSIDLKGTIHPRRDWLRYGAIFSAPVFMLAAAVRVGDH